MSVPTPRATRGRMLVDGLALLSAIGLSAFILAGFFGDRVHLFDTMAHFRGHASVALLFVVVALLAVRLHAAAFASLAAAGLGLFSVVPFLLPLEATASRPDAPRYTLLQMNLRFDAIDKRAALQRIGELKPDVVTLQEITAAWKSELETLSASYPYQFYCAPPDFRGDVAILSRRPFTEDDEGVCDVSSGFAAKRIDFEGLPFVVGTQHLRWPWPGRQWRQLADLAPALAQLGDPLIIGGDFNAAPWSAQIAAYAGASGTRPVHGIGPTWLDRRMPSFLARIAGLPIDNVLASDGVEVLNVARPAATSSDHLPVLATFTLRFAGPGAPKVQTAAR